MTDARYDRYRAMMRQFPGLFASDSERRFAILPPEPGVSAILYEDAFICIVRDAVCTPTGNRTGYLRIIPKPIATPGAAVLPIVDGKILLLRHPRHAVPGLHLECPRGFAEPGETPQTAATRELKEETGLACRELISLGGVSPDSGLLASTVELFLALNSGPFDICAEAGVSHLLVTPHKFLELISDGTIRDSFTIAAGMRAHLRGYL